MICNDYTSPNYNDRVNDCAPSMIVIHYTGMKTAQAALQRLCNPEAEVSAHYVIDEDGTLYQLVDEDKRAWHAGVSCFGDEQACNDFSIGIELEGADDTPYEAAQYQQLAEVTRCLMAAYPGITRERITGHSDIAPGRKTDPGSAFDWQRFRSLVSHPDSTRGKL